MSPSETPPSLPHMGCKGGSPSWEGDRGRWEGGKGSVSCHLTAPLTLRGGEYRTRAQAPQVRLIRP